jgi:hypothetical protein
MLIGEDLTGQDDNWNKLQAFQMLNGRKTVRLDATIGGQAIKDIVTNAADPAKPGGRSTLFGNQVLNHFNMILDNKRGLLYLKSNSRTNEPIHTTSRIQNGAGPDYYQDVNRVHIAAVDVRLPTEFDLRDGRDRAILIYGGHTLLRCII